MLLMLMPVRCLLSSSQLPTWRVPIPLVLLPAIMTAHSKMASWRQKLTILGMVSRVRHWARMDLLHLSTMFKVRVILWTWIRLSLKRLWQMVNLQVTTVPNGTPLTILQMEQQVFLRMVHILLWPQRWLVLLRLAFGLIRVTVMSMLQKVVTPKP